MLCVKSFRTTEHFKTNEQTTTITTTSPTPPFLFFPHLSSSPSSSPFIPHTTITLSFFFLLLSLVLFIDFLFSFSSCLVICSVAWYYIYVITVQSKISNKKDN
eukprot:UN10914